ncbi:MAG: exodeoxyribonuclease VII large subunit [Alphaproteobacteria bacterium]|nr:exodeoxyribonuclease VII large subunit [Alphaproteobacteria bacterium]
MSDSPPPGSNLPEYTVSEISAALKRTVESEYGRVRVRGEISGFKRAASGHLYFTLKDEDAVLDSVCWKGTAARLSLDPEDGMEVICEGRLTTYGGRSKYQIVVEAVELAGEGALLKLLEERRKKLAAEGLFDADRKQELPFLPQVIGVVTSPTGAVIRDILHRLADRFPRRVLLWPVAVQGEAAAAQVAAAIAGFDAIATGGKVPRPDLLIVARGGGSLEDLMAFNEEAPVRAAAACTIPLISAVGHETDVTLMDHAADVRAPTPTAAAEMAVPVRAELMAGVLDNARRMVTAMGRGLENRRERVAGLARGLPEPKRLLEHTAQRLDDRAERLSLALTARLSHGWAELDRLSAGLRARTLSESMLRRREGLGGLGQRLGLALVRHQDAAGARLQQASRVLESCSYRNVLARGFAVVRDQAGLPLTRAAAVASGQTVEIEFHDARREAVMDGEGAAPNPQKKTQKKAQKKKTKKPPPSSGDDGQGSLL